MLITVRQLLLARADLGLVKVDPALGFNLPTEPDVEPKPITAVTFSKLVKTATTMGEYWEQVRNVALLYCLRDTGGNASAGLSTPSSTTSISRRAC